MKALITLALTAIAALPLQAQTNVGVSVRINQPGVYGRVDFGNLPPPPVVIAEPSGEAVEGDESDDDEEGAEALAM